MHSPHVRGESTTLAVLGQTRQLETPTTAKCPGMESFGWFSARRVCGFGNEPGEAVERRLKQRWINHSGLWAVEWQLAWGTLTRTLLIF